jgi:hypothetical protein
VGRRLVVGMLRLMSYGCRRRECGHQQQASHQRQNEDLSIESNHAILPGRCRLHRLVFLNALDRLNNLVFGQQPALDIFLDAPLLIDEDAHG